MLNTGVACIKSPLNIWCEGHYALKDKYMGKSIKIPVNHLANS